MVFEVLFKGAHDVLAFDVGRSAIGTLSGHVSAPRKPAGEGAASIFMPASPSFQLVSSL
jgi:hypothetical protein